MSKYTEIQLNNKLTEIEKVSKVIEELGKIHNLPVKVVMDMCLASDEIITNIISYGYDDNDNHIIIVRINLDEENIAAEIVDDARPFNPMDIPEIDTETSVEEKEIGGLGIHLVRNLMDRIEYNRIGNKNVLLFGKKINN